MIRYPFGLTYGYGQMALVPLVTKSLDANQNAASFCTTVREPGYEARYQFEFHSVRSRGGGWRGWGVSD